MTVLVFTLILFFNFLLLQNGVDGSARLPTARDICTFAVFFPVSEPFFASLAFHEGHFMLCY